MVSEERVQKILARAGYGSRRTCEELIRAGRVTINGKRVSLGQRANADVDQIAIDGQEISLPDSFTYIILNKPQGVISDEDVKGKLTSARDLISVEGHLFPVGRLDLNSEGLLLFTDDGKLANRLTHPRYEHKKVYDVVVEGHPSEAALQTWREGIGLNGKRTLPADVEVIKTENGSSQLRITMREGRKRQIRKVAAKLGHPVKRLTRREIGPITMGDLSIGEWRHLTKEEVSALEPYRNQPAKKNSRKKRHR